MRNFFVLASISLCAVLIILAFSLGVHGDRQLASDLRKGGAGGDDRPLLISEIRDGGQEIGLEALGRSPTFQEVFDRAGPVIAGMIVDQRTGAPFRQGSSTRSDRVSIELW